MSNQIRILSQTLQPDGSFVVNAVFWLTTPQDLVAPVPSFASIDPNIDVATFLACQEGTLTEQGYVSGAFTSGTNAATVEAALVTAYTSAQSTLTAANPPDALNGNTYNGSAWSTLVQPLAWLRGAQPTIDFESAAALGLLKGVTVARVEGKLATSSTTAFQAVRATTYTAPGSNGQRSLVSDNANDNGSGSGCRSVLITYLDAAFALHTETVTLNGTTPVNTVGTNIAYVESMASTYGINAGTITMKTGTGGTGSTVGTILPNDVQTWWAQHYVPAGVTCYVVDFSVGATASVGGLVSLLHTPSLAVVGAPTNQIGGSIVHGGSTVALPFKPAIAVPGPDLIWMVTTPGAVTASTTVGGFRYVQI